MMGRALSSSPSLELISVLSRVSPYHEKHDGDGGGATLAGEVHGSGGRDETLASLIAGHREVEGHGGKALGVVAQIEIEGKV